MDHVDCVVVGAGVVGLAIAASLAQAGREVLVLEQHDLIGSETSSRNSEVIHAGIYYPTGSLKAQLCVAGKKLLYDHCDEFNVPYQRCGKVIVAVQDHQVGIVQDYAEHAQANGVHDLAWLNAEQVVELEPEVVAVAGILSPSTGIVDSHAFMLSLQGILEGSGGMIAFNTKVVSCRREHNVVVLESNDFTLSTDWLINSAGFSAPALASQLGMEVQSYFAKGHYYAYGGRPPFSHLVYPVAEPGGLGVHVTLDLAGQVKFGPDVRWQEDLDYSFDESHFDDFLRAIAHYYPAVEPTRLHPGYTGIRPKIAPANTGFQDFVIATQDTHGVPGCIHLLGIESPGLTSSLAIAERVQGMLAP